MLALIFKKKLFLYIFISKYKDIVISHFYLSELKSLLSLFCVYMHVEGCGIPKVTVLTSFCKIKGNQVLRLTICLKKNCIYFLI